jgi:hypothetical protein
MRSNTRRIPRRTHSVCVSGWPKAFVVTCSTMVTPALSTIGLSEKARNEWTSSDLRIYGSKELLTEDIGRE